MENVFRHIQEAVESHKLPIEFRAGQVNSILGIHYAGNFLVKHCQTGSSTHLFNRISKGLYRIKE
jgi:hypothetical protein